MRIRRPAAVLFGGLLMAVIGLMWVSTISARAATYTFTYNGATLVAKASVTTGTGKPVTVEAGSSITIYNNSMGTVTISGQLVAAPPKGEKTTIASKAAGTFVVPAPAPTKTTVSFTADEPGVPGTTSATGTMTVTQSSVSPSSKPDKGAGSGGNGGAPNGGEPAPGPGGVPGSGGGPFVGPVLPGGVIAPLAPGATAYPNGPAPLVAPFATATASAAPSSPGESSGTAPTSVAALSPPGGGSGTRSLGLPAAVTAVVLIGVVAALVRVLLTHPAARAVPRRH